MVVVPFIIFWVRPKDTLRVLHHLSRTQIPSLLDPTVKNAVVTHRIHESQNPFSGFEDLIQTGRRFTPIIKGGNIDNSLSFTHFLSHITDLITSTGMTL